MWAKVSTWWTYFRVSLEERMVYRGDFIIGVMMRFLPFATQVFMYWAIFETLQTNGQSEGRLTGEIGGFTFYDLIAYLLLVTVTRAFSSMPGLTSGISNSVRNGEVKKYLIQPIDMVGFMLIQRVAHKLVYYVMAFLPFAFWFFLFRDCFTNGTPGVEVFATYLLSLVLSFLLGFFLETCMGLISFWYLEVSSLTFIYMLFNFFLSGHMFPLTWLPGGFEWAVQALPFQYLAYFPAAVFLGKITGAALYWGVAVQIAWVLFFFLLSRLLWHRGVKRYSGFGG
ncbi:MAG: ABC transporter permease [Planctomycetaceae bacterium]|nr:ABC transporter permease [Planctomycetaceae bacterium]MCP4464471.1 ABC transporter permease [Planctomycetaceae bacterium]MDG1806522.1 ABC-2 family transporter protein [Pirellulaceae bacterium]MDG2105283.1 ABC-2 family transporter protein [Pirellulaceae bacterium]